MRYPRLAYDDTDRGVDMLSDCVGVLTRMRLRVPASAGIADRAVSPAPSILDQDNAPALRLHLD